MRHFTRNAASSAESQPQIHNENNYFPISPAVLNPDMITDFRVYLRQQDRFVLYTRERQRFTRALKDKLLRNGIELVYVPYHQQDRYDQYVFDNLGSILDNNEIEIDVRSQVFLETSSKHVQQIFENKLPALTQESVDNLNHIVDSSLSFLSTKQAMDSLGKFISHDYKTFSHCIHVFVYTMLLVKNFQFTDKQCKQIGIGALLHDIGKTLIPRNILDKPGKLTTLEWEEVQRHSIYGLRMCAQVSLPQRAINCILFHHEKFDGNGYPSGLCGPNLPLEVRILTCCDVYDAITSDRPYAKAETPFNALKIMNQHMIGTFDLQVFKRFISVLGPGQK